MKTRCIPVIENGRPWTVVGYAETVEQAQRVVRKHLGDHSKSLLDKGWSLVVWKRTPLAIELNGGPLGWTFAIGNRVGGRR